MVYVSCTYNTYIYVQVWNSRPVRIHMYSVRIYVHRYIQIRTCKYLVRMIRTNMYNMEYVQTCTYLYVLCTYIRTKIRFYVQWCTYLVRIIRTYTYNTEYVPCVQNNTYKYTYKNAYTKYVH